jgi:hypothetical protein
MKTKHKIRKILICCALITGATASNTSAKEAGIKIESASFSERGKPRALDLYWHKMAQCETGGNWKDTGKWSGGLGIYTQTWINYGGREFASKPEKATIEQQIIVANRISTQGYQTKNEFLTLKDRQNNKPFFRPPVGFGGWGCKKSVGQPALFKKFPHQTLFHKYKIGERSRHVWNLQKILSLKYIDGYYGPYTDRAYNHFMTKYRWVIMQEYLKYKNS